MGRPGAGVTLAGVSGAAVAPVAGRGGAVTGAVGLGVTSGSGSGCRGPERICPGRGGGTGLAGIAIVRLGGAGVGGGPGATPAGRGAGSGEVLTWPANGGRIGIAMRAGNGGRISPGCGALSSGSSWRVDSSVSGGAGAVSFGASSTAGGGSSTATATATGLSSGLLSCLEGAPNSRRTFSATSSSIELECVLRSKTPSPGRRSIIRFGLTSSSLANSLMRILLIENAAAYTLL